MKLFRSEGHIRNWAGFDPATEEGILPLPGLANLFFAKHFTRRLDPDYFSRNLYLDGFLAAVEELRKRRPFWSPS
jgi:hypothetical protein